MILPNVSTPKARWPRHGKVLALTAALMPVLLGFTAVAVDTAVVAATRAQLQTAADAAALAGAHELASQQHLLAYPVGLTEINAAQTRARTTGALNRVLGQPSVFLANSTNANTGAEDFVVGYLSRPFDPTQALNTNIAAVPYFNAVIVRTARNDTHGGSIPGFFSALWGNRGTDLRISAAAAAVGISGYRQIDSTTRANLLPIVLDKSTYVQMIRGSTTDQYTWDTATNTVRKGGDGITESKLYPVGNGYPGNWGTIKVGVSNNSTSIVGDQIRYGITPAQLATYPGGVIQPDPATGTIQFEGNPGISAGLKDDLTAIIGKPVRIPIYDPALSGGNGNNLVYTVIAFAPARILAVSFRGKNKYVIIQPAGVPDDPTAVWGGLRDGLLPAQFRLVLIR
jgi:Flp pilus assembly protein TadG